MKNKELITEYINLRIQKQKVEKPYYDVLGDGINNLLDIHFTIEQFADKLLGINEIEEDVIQDYVSSLVDGTPHWFWDTPDTLEDLVNGIMEGRFKEDE